MTTTAFYQLNSAVMLALGWCVRAYLAPCRPAGEAYEVTAIVRDTVKGDSVPYAVPVPAPAPRYVRLPPDTVFVGADTAAILAAYFAARRYRDTLLNDDEALIALEEEVSQNAIAERWLTFQNRRPTAITTTTTTVQPPATAQPKLGITLGAVAGKGLAAPMLGLEWRQWRISAGYNLAGGGVVGGISYKIKSNR
jgi:hypothetical protein